MNFIDNDMHTDNFGFWGNMTHVFVENRRLGVLTILAVFVWGFMSFMIMPKQYNPEITAPAFVVETQFPGASNEEVYRLITVPMEDTISELPQVDKIFSQSREGGVSMVTVQFVIGSSVENAKTALRQKIQGNIDQKPIGANDPVIRDVDPDTVPLVAFRLTSQDLSLASLRAVGYDVADVIKKVPQTGAVSVYGGYENHLVMDLDANALDRFGVSVMEVVQVIQNNNAGVFIDSIDQGMANRPIRVSGSVEDVEQAKKLIVKMNGDAPVFLSDVAKVSIGPGTVSSFVRFSDKQTSLDAVYVAIAKQKGSNGTTVSESVVAAVEKIREDKQLPEDVDISVVTDEGRVAKESVSSLTVNLFQSIAIVSLVLWAFLGWRSALVVAIAIPLTLAFVFGLGNLFGYTVNRITLFALILSLGLLVDSAIVVVENIERLIRLYPERKRSEVIAQAVQEVGMGLFLSTLTTVLAFIPMAFVGGMMGPYMGPIPFFVPAALLGSLIIAVTVSPYLISRITKRSKVEDRASISQKKESFFLRQLHRLRDGYATMIERILTKKSNRRRILWGTLGVFVISLLLPAFTVVPFRMLPKADKEQFFVYLDLPETNGVDRTLEVSQTVEKYFLKQDQVTSVQSFVGTPQIVDFNGLFKGSDARREPFQATLKVNLIHPNDRKETSEVLVQKYRTGLSESLADYPDVRFQMIEDPPGPPVRGTIFVKVLGEDRKIVDSITRDTAKMMGSISEVKDIDTTLPEQGYEKVYRINTEKAQMLGVSSSAIVGTMQVSLSGMQVGLLHDRVNSDVRIMERQYVLVRFAEQDRDAYQDIGRISVPSSSGKSVSITELLDEVPAEQSRTIISDERTMTEYIFAEMGNRSAIYASIDMLSDLLQYNIPVENGVVDHWSLFGVTYRDADTGKTYDVLLDGEWKLTLEVFRDLGTAFGVALVAIFFVLAVQFQSIRSSMLVMVTIPLGLIGVLPGFAILNVVQGTYFNATSMIGVIALAGIVVNNAIILLEYLSQIQKEGIPLRQALVEAGRTRFAPILLTSLTTILGSLTIISDPVWEGLAWAIFWGLSVSSFLTLVVFPVLYYEVMRKGQPSA